MSTKVTTVAVDDNGNYAGTLAQATAAAASATAAAASAAEAAGYAKPVWSFPSMDTDRAVSLTLPGTGSDRMSLLAVTTTDTNAIGLVQVRVDNPFSFKLLGGSKLEYQTGILTGTDGFANALTVSPHTDGKLYIENRLGVTIAVEIALLSGVNR